MKKTVSLICVILLCVSLYAFASAETETTTYLFETEYTYLEDVVGGGISGAAAGLNMIIENAEASNGFYVGSTHSAKCIITYVVTSDADTEATLRVIFANELSTMKLNPETLIITVNEEVFEYEEFELPAEVKSIGKTFTQFKLGDITLIEGENIITFQIGPNEYCNGAPGGPLFDAIKLTTAAELTMTEYPENIE
jgi:hypothetical protein